MLDFIVLKRSLSCRYFPLERRRADLEAPGHYAHGVTDINFEEEYMIPQNSMTVPEQYTPAL